MKKIIFLLIFFVLIGGYVIFIGGNNNREGEKIILKTMEDKTNEQDIREQPVVVIPISHASAVISWQDMTIFTDPVGEASQYSQSRPPDIILITDIHSDHMSPETIETIRTNETVLLAPEAVVLKLPESLADRTRTISNGEIIYEKDLKIEAIPMYNLPENTESFHVKGRGNGYVLEKQGVRVYVAGDTADIPEMRSLKDIDVALIPMNLPYTMSVESAAQAVLAFKPKVVYPYHYRTPDGYSDVNTFKTVVQSENPDIDVRLLNWYPENNEL